MGHTVKDVGTYSTDPIDFSDIAQKLCREVLSGQAQRGIMICGTGVGSASAVNKVNGMRAALCHDTFCAHQWAEHDDVNVLCMGAWIVGPKLADEILHAYLNARFACDTRTSCAASGNCRTWKRSSRPCVPAPLISRNQDRHDRAQEQKRVDL